MATAAADIASIRPDFLKLSEKHRHGISNFVVSIFERQQSADQCVNQLAPR